MLAIRVFLLLAFHQSSSSTWIATINPIKFSNTTLIELLDTGGYVIISADRNLVLGINEIRLTDSELNRRFQNLTFDLVNTHAYSIVDGVYDGASETSLIVLLHDESPDEERAFFYKLGEKYNQDSIIYVKRNCPVIQQLIYTTGPLSGTVIEGEGYQILSSNMTDNYSRVKLCPDDSLTFSLNFDFEHMYAGSNMHRVKTNIIREHHAQNRKLNQNYQLPKVISD